jgi:hypothetical protein
MENEKNPNEIKSNINKINIDEIQKPKTIAEFINEDEIIQFISSNLNSIISYNKENKKRQKRSKHEYLHSSLTPVISLEGFLKLIIKYTEIENNTLIVSYLYIMKLVNKENFILEKNNIINCISFSKKSSRRFNSGKFILLSNRTFYMRAIKFSRI